MGESEEGLGGGFGVADLGFGKVVVEDRVK